jgi:hypothetical protein
MVVWASPPNWPPPPHAGWQPPPGWQPRPEWGPAPPGWNFWQHPNYLLPTYHQIAFVQQGNGAATAGGVIGIFGAVLSLIPLLGIFIGIPLGIIAIVLSSVGLSRVARLGAGQGMAVTGLVLGILTVIFKLLPGVNVL